MKKELAIIVPVYNGERVIEGLLGTLLRDDRGDLEVIAVDDGSTDGTFAVLSKYRVRAIRLERNQGIAHARNAGLDAADAECAAFVDADCVVPEGWAENMVSEFKKLRQADKKIAAMSGQVLPFEDDFAGRLAAYVEHWEYLGGKPEARLKLSTSCCICDMEALRTTGKFDESLTVDEDRELALRMVSNGYTVFYDPRVSVRHRHDRTSVKAIISHQFFWGEKTGLINEWRYREIRGLWFLRFIKNPAVYLIAAPLLCAILTFRIVARVFREDKRVVWAVPFIFAAKMSYRLGVFKWLLNNRI